MKRTKFLLMLIAVGAVSASGGCFGGSNILRLLGDIAGDAVFLGGID